MKKLNTLIRLQKRELDGKRQKLTQLETRRDQYVRQIELLAEQLENELKLASELVDMRGFFGDFSGSIRQRQHKLAAQLVQVEEQIQRQIIDIHRQYAELKKYEIAKQNREARERQHAALEAQKAMDEIGIRNVNFPVGQ